MNLIQRYEPVVFEPSFRLYDFMRQAGDPGLINLAAGVPSDDLLPSEGLLAAHEAALRRSGGACHAYQLPEGDPELREMILARLRHRGVTSCESIEGVLLTTGCTQALRLALRLRVKPGDIVACESPCYYNLLEQIHDCGARVLPLPTHPEHGLVPEEIAPLLDQHRPACLVVCSSLSNPGGTTIPVAARPDLVECCRRRGVHLIEDDIYVDLCEGEIPPPLAAFDVDGGAVTYVSSFCKSVAPGLRVGVMLAGPLAKEAASRRCMETMHGSTTAESILREFLRADGLDAHLQRMRKSCVERREVVRAGVAAHFPKGTWCSDPMGGFLLWAVLPGAVDLRDCAARALAGGVGFARGDVFLTSAPQLGCLRLNAARAPIGDLRQGIEFLGGIFSDALDSLP